MIGGGAGMKLTIVNAPPTKQCHPDFPSSVPPSAAPAVMLLPIRARRSPAYNGDESMRLFELLTRLGNDEDGATLLEYTVLIAIMLVAVIATITLVGGWLGGQWTALNGALPAK
jgi:pilus assembly protein Flp/PilA